ncbi:MAG: hypothetical protein IJB70_09675 [Clostridia bacterium]|nr:hypothetical protein [Clostridia bacterium]
MKKLFLFFLIIINIFAFSACEKSEKQQEYQIKTLDESDFEKALNADMADLKYSRRLEDDIKGLSAGDNKLVLVKYKDSSNMTKYDICVAQYDKLLVSRFDYGEYVPLEIVYEEFIENFSQQNHINNLDIVYEFVEQYGINCFEDKEISELYLKRLTKNNKLINVEDAKTAIKKNIASKEAKLDIYSEFEIFFESRSAVPQYYAYKDLDSYGDVCWKVMDSDFDEISGMRFETLDELKDYLDPDKKGSFEKDYEKTDLDREDKDSDEDKKETELNPEEDAEESEKGTTVTDKPEVAEPESEEESKETEKDDEIFYRVRKSADDADSQIGAFITLERAKALADANKDAGYKVYDNKGNLVYTP